MAFATAPALLLHAQARALSPLTAHRTPTRLRHPLSPNLPCASASLSPDGQTTSTASLKTLLSDARDLGTVRFIAISAGAVLETIGRFDYTLSSFSIPNKGDYLTLASADKTFECHINASKARAVTLGTEPAKMGGHDLHVLRILGDHDALLLSCLLMWDPSQGPGHYLHGAVNAFDALCHKYGARIALE